MAITPRRKSKLAGRGGNPLDNEGHHDETDEDVVEHGDAPPPAAVDDAAEEPVVEPAPSGEVAEKQLDQPSPPATSTETSSRRTAGEPLPGPVTRNPRRLQVKLRRTSPDDMISFNCKMSRELRRVVRHYAADYEVDIQDVVAAALAEYLTRRGRDVPAFELRQPDGRMDAPTPRTGG